MQLRRLATPVVLGVAVVTVAALATSAHGFSVLHADLNDGAIWVTDNTAGQVGVGRFAKPIGQADGWVAPRSATSVDVWQDGPLVATYGSSAADGHLYTVNVDETQLANPGGTAIAPVTTPDTSGIALGGDPDGTTATLAVLGTDHSLRSATLTADAAPDLDPLAQTSVPLAKGLPGNSVVAVGTDGTIWVAGGGELREFPEGATASTATRLPSVMLATDPMQVTTVGSIPVVADATARTLYLPDSGRTVPLPAAATPAGFELQQPSGPSDVVVAASSAALYSVNLSFGQLTTLSSGHSGTVAAPVQVGGCVQAAWAQGENGTNVRDCGSPSPATVVAQSFSTGDADPQLVFRVNNGEVVLNDTANGGVFLVDSKVTNVTPQWQQGSTGVKSPVVTQTQQARQQDQFRADPVTQGVRPGTTTEVHVLDGVKGNPALTYAVTALGPPDQPGVTLAIAPDSQTVLATVTSLASDAHFQYTVDDGYGHTATGEVTLVPRTPSENSPPALKQNYQPPSLSVVSSGTLVVPVIGDWRDGDGDPLYIDSGSVSASAGSAAVTSGGALSFTAPHTTANETVTLTYGVSDGRVTKPTMVTLKVSVLGLSAKTFVAPVAEPDAAQAVAGTPITLQPLTNDISGVDWTNPQAKLRLAAPVTSVAGTTVSTDVADGRVTFTAQRAGDYFLTYTDAYGAAPTAKGTIRVHVIPASSKPQPPVTTPDVAVLHGQQPALVDVLADDSDPQGWLMGITDATSATPGVHVTVIDQEWLRISADDPVPGMTATVAYTVSDGKGSATGTVSVSAVAADPSADQITTTNATITVRAGDSAAVPVLAGDASATGLPLSLAGTPPTVTPPVAGLLVGVQGDDIRVDAPASVKTEEETAVSYVATDADGTTEAGELDVTVMPAPSKADPDQAPVPEEVDAREAAGDTVVIQIPTSGVDPDGDSVTVTGVTVPPALGRIVAVGPDSVSYQSYPGSAGTDTFTYQVTDPYGLTGTAQVRIAVLPPGPPQPPVAVDDVINAPPGASLHWNVLANDYIAPGDTVTVESLDKTNAALPAGVRLASPYVYLKVPASPSAPPVQFTYGATDGTTPSLAQVIVHPIPGAKVPPIADDVVAPLPGAGAKSVTVNVLKNDDDPVGSASDLKVTWAASGATIDGANLTVKLACYPYAVPYQVTAPDGLTATAVVYVQGTISCPTAANAPKSTITLKPGAKITLPANGTANVLLSSVLTDSAGRQLKITATSNLTASPAGDIAVSANQETTFTVHALGGYSGPGAVTVQVYDGQTIQDKNGTVASVSIPVQVGANVPALHCPAAPLQIVEGGAAQSYDIGQLCHVSADTTQAPPRYTVSWTKAAPGVSATAAGGTALQLSAASTAEAGATGTLKIALTGANAGNAGTGGTLGVQVVKAPLPTGRPASASARAGQSVTVDLSQYVTSPLRQPVITVLGVTTQTGSTATATVTHSGSKVTVTPGAAASGTLNLTASVSDEAGRTDRAISVAITVTVTGRPGAPGRPTATASGTALVVSFSAAAPNGTPIEYYTVYTNGTGHQCAASPCTVTGLTSGSYMVYVTATNSAGTGPQSAQATAQLSTVPGQVTGVTATPGDGQVALTWQAATGNPTGYEVEVSPAPTGASAIRQLGAVTSDTVTGLTDGTSYTFTVAATGAAGNGPQSVAVTAVPLGKPVATTPPLVTNTGVVGTNSIIEVSAETGYNANGSPAQGYTVYEYKASSSSGPFGGTAVASATQPPVGGSGTVPRFTVANDGSWYEYAYTVTNGAGTSALSPLSAPIQAVSAQTVPPRMAAPDAANVIPGSPAATRPVTVTWQPAAASVAVTSYTVYEYEAPSVIGASGDGPGAFGTNPVATQVVQGATSASTTFTVNTDGSFYEYTVAATSQAGASAQSPMSGYIFAAAPADAPTGVTAAATGQSQTIRLTFTTGAANDRDIDNVEFAFNGSANYSTINGPFAAHTTYSETLTSGASPIIWNGISFPNGTPLTVSVRACNHLAPCGPWSSPSNQVTPTGPSSTGTAPSSSAANPSVSVSNSGVQGTSNDCLTTACTYVDISVSGFPAGASLIYTCSRSGFQYFPTQSFATAPVTTNANGDTSFQSGCAWDFSDTTDHLQASVVDNADNVSATSP